MEQAVFYILAVLAVGFALGTVAHPNALKGALCLLGCLISIACIYVLLNAHLIAALQVIVYAGGIAVLFVLIITLINLRPQDQSFAFAGYHKLAFAAILVGATVLPVLTIFLRGAIPSAVVFVGLVTAAVAMALFYRSAEQRRSGILKIFYGLSAFIFVVGTPVALLFEKMGAGGTQPPPIEDGFGTAGAVGRLLFGKYLVTFEAAGVLLLAAIVGVVLMASRTDRARPPAVVREDERKTRDAHP